MRVAILATDGFEEVELTSPLEALRDAGARVEVVAPKPGRIQAMRHDEKSIQVDVDHNLDDIEAEEYDALMLPGGVINADALRMNWAAQAFVRAMDAAGKPIAVICHAPWLLISAGLVRGRTLTSYYTLQDDIRNAGGTWLDQEVVTDGNWVSSRNPGDLPAFNRAMIALFTQAASTRQPLLAGR
jgi:protease I